MSNKMVYKLLLVSNLRTPMYSKYTSLCPNYRRHKRFLFALIVFLQAVCCIIKHDTFYFLKGKEEFERQQKELLEKENIMNQSKVKLGQEQVHFGWKC